MSDAIEEPTEAEVAEASAKLKACPFCGSRCVVEWTPVPDFSQRHLGKAPAASIAWHIKCTNVGSRCPHGQHWLCSTKDAAVNAWNQRANPEAWT